MRQRLKRKKEENVEPILKEISKEIIVTAKNAEKTTRKYKVPKEYRRRFISKEAMEEAKKLASIFDKASKYGVSKLKWVG